MKRRYLIAPSIVCALFVNSCGSDDTNNVPSDALERNFDMGFTSWSFGATQQDVDDTYAFIGEHATIYAEHVDNQIPWNAWMNDTTLPVDFANEITGKADKKIAGKKLLLSVSLLNANRDDLAEDVDGSVPSYSTINDLEIEDAYTKHVQYLVDQFLPDYLVIAIEVNELRLRSSDLWEGYQALIQKVTSRIKGMYPDLPISASISLHNLFEPTVGDPTAYIDDVVSHMNQQDFVAISYYPFLKNQKTATEFQETLDFLHDRVSQPIAFVETSHLAEGLIIPNLNVSITGTPEEQNVYLETLLANARDQDYEFIIWWAHRDYDALWETFPAEVKDVGQIWRDTGLLDEDGTERPAFSTWKTALGE